MEAIIDTFVSADLKGSAHNQARFQSRFSANQRDRSAFLHSGLRMNARSIAVAKMFYATPVEGGSVTVMC
jgi:hypothetical protein